MRTTLNIDDQLLQATKRRAAQRGQTLGEVVNAALQRELNREDAGSAPDLPVFTRGSGPAPGVDLTSNRALQEMLDEGVPLDRRR